MIVVIRIHGRVNVRKDIAETLRRLNLHRKLHCMFIDEKDGVKLGMLAKVKDYVSFGEVDEKFMKQIIEKRGAKTKAGEYKDFCRLTPPVGGFKRSTKKSAGSGKGILGKNKDIVKLLERMIK